MSVFSREGGIMHSHIYTAASIIWLWCAFSLGRGCEHGWLSFEKNCYKIYIINLTHLSAARLCALEGSKLASISSQSVLGFLTEHLATASANSVWVGLRRTGYGLEWNDGTSATGQPWIGASPRSLNYAGTSCFAYNGAKVEEATCYRVKQFVCQHNKTTFSKNAACTALHETSFTGEVTGRCIYSSGPVKRASAEKTCETAGGQLLDIDEILKDGLSAFHEHKVLSNDGSKYWTGLVWNGTNVIWKSGEVLKPDYPIPFYAGEGNCTTVLFNFTNVLETHLFQTNCEDEAYVVCGNTVEIPSTTVAAPSEQQDNRQCPSGYNWRVDRLSGYCYWETSYETSRLSWDDARRYCRSFGGDLASFHTTEEEKIGLSFQYGTLAHPYWIGLRLDVETETYKWSDGAPLDYENWAPGHPDHKDKRRQCVAMNADSKNWMSSLCGILSWFVCKAPKQLNPTTPVIPTPSPLVHCDDDSSTPRLFYHNGFCYNVVSLPYSWHRSRLYCENEGSTLVSIHSDEEIGFLLRMLYEDKSLAGNRVWIGLNSLSDSGSYKWTDWSPVDFTYWNDDEPNNFQNQEKCCNMYVGNGLWNDENCNANMGFICKRPNDTSVTLIVPTTRDPRIGNCKNGWFAYHDSCYYLVGENPKQRANWSEANEACQSYGGYLVSIRNPTDQAFLGYLIQRLKEDTWIGLHDTIQSGSYYWLDNSDLTYTNWAPGEPSFFGIQEDCVMMVYNTINSGVWKDEECHKKLPYICRTSKDPNLPEPANSRGIYCLHPEGWLKLDNLCFKMFFGNPMSWEEAEIACERDGAHLVSVTDSSVQAVVSYLATEVNETFWIGLQYKKSSQKITWLNGRPSTFSKWGNNEPGILTDDLCFASTPTGYWTRAPCTEQMSYVCQITTGDIPNPTRYIGDCPKTAPDWIAGGGSFCYTMDSKHIHNFYAASYACFKAGSNLVSLHSMEDVSLLKKVIPKSFRYFFIGLMRSANGGFMWTDNSAVDFVDWEEGHPANSDDNCVRITTDTFKWQVTSCMTKAFFVCSTKKVMEVDDVPEIARLAKDSTSSLSTGALVGILVCLLLAVAVIVAALLYYKPIGTTRLRIPARQHSVSFENALYNVQSASMEFQDENQDSFKL